ncbi:putative FAD binding domain protein [Neofusicoccum parvum]|nr:putative FAD binding domain protein [Neofusicoccum parvum]
MSSSFKVIIAGGSLVGLGLALCFERAGIDYVLLEKGEIGPQLGASIGIHPHTIRILEQLGVWKDIEGVVTPLLYRQHFDENGKCFEDSKVLSEIKERAKRPIIFMERCEELRILYSHVKDKSKIHAHTAVESYDETDEGVTVTTSNGESFSGSILIGADGIHSRVRTLMADQISKTQPDLATELKEGFAAEYKCIFAVSRNGTPEAPLMPDGTVHNVYYDYYSAVSATGVPGLVFWFLFVKMGSVTRTPHCPRFSEADMEALIGTHGHNHLGPTYTIKQLWDARVKASMVPLEEGVLKKWSHGRVVLLGDSIHKATVNPGLGGNLAYEGIAHLTNRLVPLLRSAAAPPSAAQLTELFDSFDAAHRPRAETVVKLSGTITRYEAQDTWWLKGASRWVVPWVSDARKADAYVGFSNGGPRLEWLPDPDGETAAGEARL